ncbi:hypothetical protein SARC_01442 [Sphaeroforma arctica JP610]|uniref:Uncharacterized protein n=1 Tax=Sphaeroforma arctica JP610 TaxID=667725 RepID=A0A0L0GBJ8_9EUKA|nr:hypothetical protein SARC_01442 [Sphaeroforma arctica JP610]KNC86392.1 hypothetical protein SARC_01442 [Sphaeroforma arctica JP610]|eukprot:XP_014160294.1 hypothetical protein SARC_01442 [Sphaeroforma arctica JP610]
MQDTNDDGASARTLPPPLTAQLRQSLANTAHALFNTPKRRAEIAKDMEERERRKREGIDEPTEMELEEIEAKRRADARSAALRRAAEVRNEATEEANYKCIEDYARMMECVQKGSMFKPCFDFEKIYGDCRKRVVSDYIAQKKEEEPGLMLL